MNADKTIKQLTDEALDLAIKQAVMSVIAGEVGYGIKSEVKDAIHAEATRLCAEDPEIKAAIRDATIHWIRRS